MKQISISFLILIIISLELCAFFTSSSVFASKTLKGHHEFAKIDQCEKKFWWKNRKNFQKDLESLCMKQQHDHHDKYKKRYHKSKDCDKSESWDLKYWINKKNTWENLDQSKCTSSKNLDKGRWKKSQKLLWKQFQKVADCKCSVLNYKLTNQAGISVCHQIASLNKASGEFIGVFTVFRSLKYDKFKGKPALLSIKYDENIKVKTDGLKKDSDDYLVGLSPLFTFKSKDSRGNIILISKAFIKGKVPSKKSMNKISIDDISPVKYKVTVKVDKATKKVFKLKLGSDVKNVPISKFIPSTPYSPYLIDNDKKKNDPNQTTTSSQSQTPTETKQEPTATNPNPNQPTATNPNLNQPAPTNPDTNQPAPTNPDTNQPAPTNPDPNQPDPNQPAPNQQDPNQTTPTNPDTTDPNTLSGNSGNIGSSAIQDVPGSAISTPPIGLIVFAVVVAVGAAFVGYTTYERRRYRNQFNRRQNMQQQNPSLAAVPDFGRAV